jgi:hypothetical protein
MIMTHLYSQNENNTKKKEEKKIIETKFNLGYAYDMNFVHNKQIGYWGFVDYNTDKDYLDGFLFGVGFNFLLGKHINLFFDLNRVKSSILLGKSGSNLHGMAIWEASQTNMNYVISDSPLLDRDIYYVSKTTYGVLGLDAKFPIDKTITPYIGFGLGMASYEAAFGNNKGTRKYSDLLTGVENFYLIKLGVNFNIYDKETKLFSIGLYYERGRSVTDVSQEITNWLWQGWTYRNQFIVVPMNRMGIQLAF